MCIRVPVGAALTHQLSNFIGDVLEFQGVKRRLCQVANLFVNTLSGEHGVQVKVVSSREYKVDWMRNVNRGLEGNVWL